eukprot:3323784-Rhodomonas_salina.1
MSYHHTPVSVQWARDLDRQYVVHGHVQLQILLYHAGQHCVRGLVAPYYTPAPPTSPSTRP